MAYRSGLSNIYGVTIMSGTNSRLTAIEARARAAKFAFGKSGVTINGVTRYFIANAEAGYEFLFPATPAGLQAAERLLSCYKPGPVIHIGNSGCFECDLDTGDQACNFPCGQINRPGNFKVVRCDDE